MTQVNDIQDLFNTFFNGFIKSNIRRIDEEDENKEFKVNMFEKLIKKWNKEKVQAQMKECLEDLEKEKNKKKKKVKDPNRPKKGKSSYVFFCVRNRNKIKTKNPEMKMTEVTSKLGELWRNLKKQAENGNEKAVKELENCVKLAEEDKERYISEMQSYVEQTEEEITKEKKKKKKKERKDKKKEGTLIKRIVTQYQCFVKEHRVEVKTNNPDMKFAEVSKELGVIWKKLKEDAKNGVSEAVEEFEKYKKITEEDKIRYYNEKMELEKKLKENDEKE